MIGSKVRIIDHSLRQVSNNRRGPRIRPFCLSKVEFSAPSIANMVQHEVGNHHYILSDILPAEAHIFVRFAYPRMQI